MADSMSSEENSEAEEVSGEEEELQSEEVSRLGGTQADYVLSAAIDDPAELVDGGKKGAIDDLEEGELEGFITKSGIRNHAGCRSVSDGPEGGAAVAQNKAKKAGEASAEGQVKKQQKKKKEAQKSKQNSSSFEFQPRQVSLIKPGGKWFELEYASEGSETPQDPASASRYQASAQRSSDAEAELYRTRKNSQRGANSAWMKTVVSSGVSADRMAAMTSSVQDAPVHTSEHVETSVSMVKKKGSRRMGSMASDTLKESSSSNLSPEDRKLRPFAQRPFDQSEERASGNRDARDRRLVSWLFEHRSKQQVAEFVAASDAVGHDTVAATKAKASAAAHESSCGRPEQERASSIQVVNKSGDPEYKMAAKASHSSETSSHRHPNMKAVVCSEVERLSFRPNVGAKAQYYAVCFSSQVMSSHEEAPLAARLIAAYFAFFRACVKKKDVESKMSSASSAGVSRAYPYADAGDEKVREQSDTSFRVVHVARFNTAVQALMSSFQVSESQQSVSDRFYVASYRKSSDPASSASSRQNMFLNSSYKASKADVAPRRVKAFIKRSSQVSAEQSAAFACGALFSVSEVMRAKPGLRISSQQGEDGDEEEEEFKDLSEEEEEREEGGACVEEAESRPAASWVHHKNSEGGRSSQNYDPLHRNPSFCGADCSALWESHRSALHFHPSVASFARTVSQGEPVQYSGDPSQDFTSIRFSDRFVFRNPKQSKGKQNTDSAASRPRQRFPTSSLPVNCAEFSSKEESQIPVEEVFFHRFFKKRQQEKMTRRRSDGDDGDSVEDVDDDEFEEVSDSLEKDSYFTDSPGEDSDFAGNVKSKKGKKCEEDSEESDSDDEEVSSGSMDEEDFGEESDEEGGTFMDPDAPEPDDVPDDSEEEMEVPDVAPRIKIRKRKSCEDQDFSLGHKKEKRKKAKRDGAMFASAEEFGSSSDENADSRMDSVGSNAVSNADKAGSKQSRWESQRDDWIRGRDAKTSRRKKSASFRRRATAGRAPFRKKRK